MNAKTCKRLRRVLQSSGLNPSHATYKMNAVGTVELDSSCGRSRYKQLKVETKNSL